MATLPEYPITPVNKLGRLSKRGCYDYSTIHQLINGCPLLHASFTTPSSPFPVVLPMIGCTGSYSNPSAVPEMTPQDIYLHGHVASRMFRQAAAKPSGEETETEAEEEQEEQGMPITISASFLDGLVLSLTPFHNSCNYRSAVVFGYAKLVTDDDEAMYAMKLITENMLPGRWDDSRVPPTKAELKSTGVMRVKIVSASAKIRTGGPSEDRADLKNEELVKKTWTGVVPYFPTWKTPCPGTQNKCEKVPEYIEGWRADENQRAEMYAFEAVGEAEKK